MADERLSLVTAALVFGVPVLEADDRALCLQCGEAQPDHPGVEPEAIEMLRTLTRIVSKPG